MGNITALIADDEDQLRYELKKKLGKIWPDLEICCEAENGIKAVKLAEKHRPDIAFLDIRMPGKSGLEAAKEINSICKIVFITAYDQYALDAFDNEALDYILKPIEDSRLAKTARRLKKQLTSKENKSLKSSDNIDKILQKISRAIPELQGKKHLQWIKAQHRDTIELISVETINYFKAMDKYTTLFTNDKEYLIRKTIKDLEKELDPEMFWRIHRGTIVKVSAITKVSRSITGKYIIKVSGEENPLTVSRSYIHLFKHM
jgi:DNA-binding LytR/AlgR family response regulator